MQQLEKAIGVLGGTFDPIHHGHLRLAIESLEVLDLAKVHLVPCYQPVHRSQPTTSATDRLAMLSLAIENESRLYIDTREIIRKGPSYAIDTLKDIRNEMPNTPLCLLVGLDAFLGFDTWHEYEKIFDLAHVIITNRPSFELPDKGILIDLLKARLQREFSYISQHLAGGIFLLPISALQISASEIRKLIAMGRNPRYLLPDKVYNYIQQQGIYTK